MQRSEDGVRGYARPPPASDHQNHPNQDSVVTESKSEVLEGIDIVLYVPPVEDVSVLVRPVGRELDAEVAADGGLHAVIGPSAEIEQVRAGREVERDKLRRQQG